MQRTLVFIYGVIAYAIFFITFLYAAGFISNFLVPVSIDSAPRVPFVQALLINLALLTVFAVQHSVMARKPFKRWLTQYIPGAAERSTFVLASSLALILVFVFWEPMGGVIWHVQDPTARTVIWGVALLGWFTVLYTTFLINHFDLFGLRQIWLNLREKPYTQVDFVQPWLYRLCRHPLYLGFMIAFWATPTMTVAHLVFALACTGYIFVGITLEERDLMAEHPEYAEYRQRVPMVIPFLGRRKKQPDATERPAATA